VSLRLKILALACLVLAAFAVTTALSASLIRRVMDKMGGIVEYHIGLTERVAEVDVLTFEYELNLRRLTERRVGDPEQLRRAAAREKAIADRLHVIFKDAHALVTRAVADERNDLSDRLVLARVDGVLDLLGRQVGPFVAQGTPVMKALEERRFDEAIRLMEGFAAYEQAFGPDLAQVRQVVINLTRESVAETRQQSASIRRINALTFVGAAVIGLGLFTLLGYRLHGAFRRLLDGTRRVEEGQLTVELPVTSRDEIGQLTGSFNRMIAELRSKERIKDTFGKFVDPRIVATLLGGQAAGQQAAERRAVTIFFSDIKGFSSLSEQLTADVMVRVLNAYFTAVTKVIREQRGIVDKYIGDAVMAFWAPPFSPGDQHAADACLAALAQQEAIGEFRRALSDVTGLRRNVPDFKVRMGLATGEVVIGTIGSETTKSYTVIGDTVNVASRLEGVNKVYGTSIIASEETVRLAGHVVEARELDLLIVTGKTEPLRVFELLGRAGALAPALADLREAFAEGLAAYRETKWDVAERKFHACLALAPADGPARAFLERVALLRATPPGGDWNGVWGLDRK
jgi:adenylate cyclase